VEPNKKQQLESTVSNEAHMEWSLMQELRDDKQDTPEGVSTWNNTRHLPKETEAPQQEIYYPIDLSVFFQNTDIVVIFNNFNHATRLEYEPVIQQFLQQHDVPYLLICGTHSKSEDLIPWKEAGYHVVGSAFHGVFTNHVLMVNSALFYTAPRVFAGLVPNESCKLSSDANYALLCYSFLLGGDFDVKTFASHIGKAFWIDGKDTGLCIASPTLNFPPAQLVTPSTRDDIVASSTNKPAQDIHIGYVATGTPLIFDPEERGNDKELESLERDAIPNTEKVDQQQIRYEVEKEIDKAISKLAENVTSEQKTKLREMLIKNIAAFALEQSQCKMSRLTPIRAVLTPNHPSIAQKPRTMSFEKLEFLRIKIDDLVRIGMLEPNFNPLFGSPCFVVPKKGPKRFRMVVDLRLLNKYTQATPLDLPNLENQLQHLQNASYSSSFDVISGFDFLPVEDTSQEIFTIVTPFGAYKMKGAPMGWINTPMLFQTRIVQEVLHPTHLFCRASNGIAQWIDDTLIYGTSFDNLINMTDSFLKQVINKGLRLNIKKCTLYAREIEFCGRILREGRWSFHQKYFKAALMSKPNKLHQLMDVIYVAQWLSLALPDFAKLRDRMAGQLNAHGYTKKQLKRMDMDINWTDDMTDAWQQFQSLLVIAARKGLAQYDHSKELALFTDASKSHWSAVVVQIPPLSDDTKEIQFETLVATPLLFLSGKFTSSQKKWHITQLELYPIIKTFLRCKFLLGNPSKTVNVFTDHKSLEYLLDPTKATNKNHQERLSRWCMIVQSFRSRVFHIPARYNVLADLLTRWGYSEEVKSDISHEQQHIEHDMVIATEKTTTQQEYDNDELVINAIFAEYEQELLINASKVSYELQDTTNQIHIAAVRTEQQRKDLVEFQHQYSNHLSKDAISFYHPYYEGDYSILDHKALLQYQIDAKLAKPSALELSRDSKSRVLLPEKAIPHLLVSTHISNFHQRLEVDLRSLAKYSIRNCSQAKLKNHMKNFRAMCLHCQRRPYLLRTPLNSTITGRKPRAVLRMDFLKINEAGGILVIIDTFTRKTFLRHCTHQTAEEAVRGLLDWHSVFQFGIDFLLITDNGAHFANRLMKSLFQELRGNHTFSVAFAPWTNGSVENRNTVIIKALRQLTDELGFGLNQWPQLLPQVMAIINQLPIKSRLDKTSNELFLRIEQSDLLPFYRINHMELLVVPVSSSIKSILDSFVQELTHTHDNKIYDSINLAKDMANAKSKTIPILQFRPGDFVLYSTKGRPSHTNKLSKVWVGPMRVTEVKGHNVYSIESLSGKQYRSVHANRLWFYADDHFVPDIYIEKMAKLSWNGLEIDRIVNIRSNHMGLVEIGLIWYGFDEVEWISLEDVVQGAHLLLRDFLLKNKKLIDSVLYQESIAAIQTRQLDLTAASVSFEKGGICQVDSDGLYG